MQGKNKYRSAIFLLLLLSSVVVTAQQDTLTIGRNYKLLLNNDEVVTGFYTGSDKDYVILEMRPSFTEVFVRRNTIVKVTPVTARDAAAEDPLGENPHADMYLVSSAVLPFQKDCFSTSAHWFIFDQIQYAFTKNVAVYVTSLTFYPCGAGVKVSHQVNDLTYIGADVSGMMRIGNQDVGSEVLGYMAQAKLTHGTSNRNFTIGAGIMGINPNAIGQYNAGELLLNSPVVSAGFCNRFAERWSLVLDGYYLSEENVLFGGCGFKFLRDEEIAWCFGAYSHVNELGAAQAMGHRAFAFPIPYLSYTRKFL
jgi:hypothetical protein